MIATLEARRLLALVYACAIILGHPFAHASEDHWLIGSWHGALDGPDSGSKDLGRTMVVHRVSPNGTARGSWSIADQREYVGRIRVEGARVSVVTAANSVVELTREDGDRLAGTIAFKRGEVRRVTLSKRGGASDRGALALAGALVGKWEGDASFLPGAGSAGMNPSRTLYVDSVRRLGDGWTAEGRYGITGKGVVRVVMKVDATGRTPEIEFVTPIHSTVRLKLLTETHLVGTTTYIGAGAISAPESLTLTFVE